MTISNLLIYFFVCLLYFVMPIFIIIFVKNKKAQIIINTSLLCCFVVILFFATICNVDISKHTTSISFDFSQNWCNKNINWMPYTKSLGDFLINVTMLFPIGVFTACFSKRKLWITLLISASIGLLCGLTIEAYQFILPVSRSVQLSDVLLNCVSVVLGSLYASAIIFIKNKSNQKSCQNANSKDN